MFFRFFERRARRRIVPSKTLGYVPEAVGWPPHEFEMDLVQDHVESGPAAQAAHAPYHIFAEPQAPASLPPHGDMSERELAALRDVAEILQRAETRLVPLTRDGLERATDLALYLVGRAREVLEDALDPPDEVDPVIAARRDLGRIEQAMASRLSREAYQALAHHLAASLALLDDPDLASEECAS